MSKLEKGVVQRRLGSTVARRTPPSKPLLAYLWKSKTLWRVRGLTEEQGVKILLHLSLLFLEDSTNPVNCFHTTKQTTLGRKAVEMPESY